MRAYFAPSNDERCQATIHLRVRGASKEQKESADCMRRREAGSQFCKQHARLFAEGKMEKTEWGMWTLKKA